VIYNFVDVAKFNKKPLDTFKKLLAPNGEKIIIHASNFRKLKRVDDVIKIFVLLSERINCKLLLIGDGPERPYIEDVARNQKNCSDIKFLGKQEQMEDILPYADLFLLPSEYESFGLAALEAMAAEVPVISSNAGGLPEININGVTGYTSEVGNIEEMAENAYQIISDPSIHFSFKKNALKEAKKFDIDNIIPQYEDLYKKLLS
jgi:N-acetyl-alpha-D-glucosaminyl L-malate synthase BshA